MSAPTNTDAAASLIAAWHASQKVRDDAYHADYAATKVAIEFPTEANIARAAAKADDFKAAAYAAYKAANAIAKADYIIYVAAAERAAVEKQGQP